MSFSQLGLLNTILLISGRLLPAINKNMRLHKYYLFAQPVVRKQFLPKGKGESINIRFVEQADKALKSLPRSQQVIRSRYKQGASCLGAFKGEEMIGCIWLQLGAYDEDEVRCRFIPAPIGESAWDFDIYIEKKHRIGYAFLKLWDATNDYLEKRGIEWSMSRISAFNINSIASHSRLGAQRLGSAMFICLASWQLMLSTLPPYFYLSTRVESIPEIYLRSPA